MNLFNPIVPLVKWFTVASLLLPSLLLIFKRKCRNQKNFYKSPTSSLMSARLGKLARLHAKLVLFLYLLDIIKYLLLIALDLDFMRAHRWIDCFVVGRLAFVGRTGKDAKYLGLLVTSYGLIYRSLLIYLKPTFTFQCVEFILNGQAAALESEMKSLEMNKRVRHNLHWFQQQQSIRKTQLIDNSSSTSSQLNLCYFVPNHFSHTQAALNLRPNRSLDSWKVLNICAFAFGTFLLAYFAVANYWLALTIGPQLLTNLGFKLNYALCHSWLMDQKRLFNRTYAEIYLVSDDATRTTKSNHLRNNITQVVSIYLPVSGDLATPTGYNLLRIAYDLIQNYFLYFDFFTTLALHTQNIFLIMFDVYINYKIIERRLLEVRYLLQLGGCDHETGSGQQELQRQFYATVSYLELLMNFLFQMPARHGKRYVSAPVTAPLAQQVARIQSTLVDHFVMIHRYNRYVEFHFRACMTMWLAYTSSLCAWMGYAGFERVSLEFYIAFLISLILVVFLLSGPAFLRTSNCKLYSLIGSTMALDTNLATKARWINILNYYFPAPLFCFSFFRAYQLCWFFCLKLYSWVITALLVVASFMVASKAHA